VVLLSLNLGCAQFGEVGFLNLTTARSLLTLAERVAGTNLFGARRPFDANSLTELNWRMMMEHDAQALLALSISAALCLGAWVWARQKIRRIVSKQVGSHYRSSRVND
jgi:hypothetical protein